MLDVKDDQLFNDISMKLRDMQWLQDFYVKNHYTNYRDKKLWDLRPTTLNPLYKIKLYKFTWLFYPKDSLSSTYNLIHVYNATTFNCSSGSLQPRWMDESLQRKIQRSNPWIRDWKWCDTLLSPQWELLNKFEFFF